MLARAFDQIQAEIDIDFVLIKICIRYKISEIYNLLNTMNCFVIYPNVITYKLGKGYGQ